MSNARRVGIDVQVVDPSIHWRELLDIVCTDDERQALVSSSKDSQPPLFFRCWTAKEALLKLTGVGIAEGLQSVSVNPFASGSQRLPNQLNENTQATSFFQFHWIAEIDDCVACIAFEA
jgi:4'-phosphopantetheinyl transferase